MEIFRRLKDETGGALSGAIAVVFVVTILIAGGVYVATQGADQASAKDSEQLAQEASESGLDAASSRIAAEDDTALYDGGEDDSAWSPDKGGRTIDLGDGSKVTVTIEYAGESSDGFSEFRVESSGTADQARRVLQGTIVNDGTDSWGPVALDDRAATTVGNAVPVNVIKNDYDPDDQPLTLVGPRTLATPTALVECSADGMCLYTPSQPPEGEPPVEEEYEETFEYEITDPDGQRDTAVVTVVVIPVVLDPPVKPQAADDSYDLSRSKTRNFNVLANDEPGSSADTLELVGKDSDGLKGTLNCKATGVCSYTAPKDTKIKRESFTYEIADANGAGAPESATVKLNIVDPAKPEKADPPKLPPAASRCLNLVPSKKAFGNEGANVFNSGQGSQTFSGSGANSVSTGSGNDRIMIGKGASRIDAGSGNDIVVVGSGATSINGGPGMDLIVILNGAMKVDGGDGNDVICLGSGAASAQGGTGNDVIRNEEGASSVDGGSGNDTLLGTGGVAAKDGGVGDDELRFSGQGVTNLDPGPGRDEVNLVGSGVTSLDFRDGSRDVGSVRGNYMCSASKDSFDRISGGCR